MSSTPSRREFVKLAAIAAAGAPFVPPLVRPLAHRVTPTPSA
jgi:hypothetical protein